ncbi:MAG: MFS transporter, partial [Armatimonadota bacterium]|nr:MFS transporter [Armatimonadota bacterium]
MITTANSKLWRNRDFLLLWSGQAVSVLGTKISNLALPLLVLATTHSAVQAGLITSARMIPYLLLGLPAGVLVDRWNRKTAMIICDLARGVALGAVPVAWAFGHLSLVLLYAVALVQGTAFVFFNVAEMACLPNVVPREDLPQATAMDSVAGSAGSLVGPGLAGIIISAARTTAAGDVLAYLIDALTYLASVVSLLFIRVPFQVDREETPKLSLVSEVKAGIRFLWADGRLRTLALTSWALSFLYAPVPLAMIVLAKDILHASPRMIGLIFSLSAIGGLIGAAVATRLKSHLSFGAVIIGSVAAQALVTPLVGLALSPWMLTCGWAIAFMMDPIFSMASVSYRLATTPDDMRGRVHSIYRMGGYGAEPLGTALGGLCLGWVGPRAEILAVAAGVGLCAIALSFSKLRATGWPGLSEDHQHPHKHERLEHSHAHTPDDNHQHKNGVDDESVEPHTKKHVQDPM